MTHDPQTHDPKYGNYAEFSSPATPIVKEKLCTGMNAGIDSSPGNINRR
jgi:hypothetical protein